MNLARPAAVVALFVSLAGNALLASALARNETRHESAAEGEKAPASVPPTVPAPPPARKITFDRAGCQGLTTLEDDLSQRSAALRGVLPPQLLFERGQANPEAERLLAPVVARLVAAIEVPEGKHTLECRDVACKLVFNGPASTSEEAWDQALSRSTELQAWSQQFTLGQATPTVAGRLVAQTVYFKLDGPRAVAAGRGGR
jgi:hypothetical protein